MNQSSFETMRAAMIVSQLRTSGVNDPAVLAAMGSVAREDFVEPSRRAVAYADATTPVAPGRALLPPDVLGKLIQKAELKHGEKALVIGGSTGYSAAVLAAMGLNTVMVESHAALVDRAGALLGDAVRLVEAPLASGTKKGAPFDFILIDGAVEEVPPALVKLLADGGRLACVLVDSQGIGRAACGLFSGGAFSMRPFADAPAAARLPGFERARAFQF